MLNSLTLRWTVRFLLFIDILLCENPFKTPATKGACVQLRADGTRNASQDQFLDYTCASRWRQACRRETSARSRFVGSSLTSRCLQYLYICGTEIRAQGRVENSIRVGSVGPGYFETRWPQFVPPESADQAIAKVLPFPAPTDCKSADECVPRDNCLKEVRATLEVDRIERNSK